MTKNNSLKEEKKKLHGFFTDKFKELNNRPSLRYLSKHLAEDESVLNSYRSALSEKTDDELQNTIILYKSKIAYIEGYENFSSLMLASMIALVALLISFGTLLSSNNLPDNIQSLFSGILVLLVPYLPILFTFLVINGLVRLFTARSNQFSKQEAQIFLSIAEELLATGQTASHPTASESLYSSLYGKR